MSNTTQTLIDLEKKFWQSMVDQNAGAAIGLLNEQALMVSGYGAMQFDHAGYRKMADQGTMIVKSFKLDDVKVMFPNDAVAILTYKVSQSVAPRDGKAPASTQEMNDSSTWIKAGNDWKCVMHTETPVQAMPGKT